MNNKVIISEIQDSWETIVDKINNGTANYSVGQYKPLDLGCQGIVNMQIVKINLPYMPWYEFVAMETLKMEHQMNDWHSLTNEWADSSMRTYLHKMIFPLIPEVVRNSIKCVTKISYTHSGEEDITDDLLWIPSYEEIFGGLYGDIYHDAKSRRKVVAGTSCASGWWLRSADSGSSNFFRIVYTGGGSSNGGANASHGVALGFSL